MEENKFDGCSKGTIPIEFSVKKEQAFGILNCKYDWFRIQ